MRRRTFVVQGLILGFVAFILAIYKLYFPQSNSSSEPVTQASNNSPSPSPSNAATPSPSKPPNIIVIVADDLRWDCLGILGNRIIQTPNLDQLALEGTLFLNNFVTTSICSSSRASIFTGQYSRRHKIWDFDTPLQPQQFQESYPELLKKAGYKIGFIGKWGLGGELPKKSFDYWRGFEGHGNYFEPKRKEHLDRLLTEQAIEFIDQSSSRNPFCLSISYKSPHAQDGDPNPFQPDPEFAEVYKNLSIPPIFTNTEAEFQNLPQFLHTSEGRLRWEGRFDQSHFENSVKQYYRLVTGMDNFIGQIIKVLKEKNLYDNTCIVFTSDNGFFLGDRGLSDKWFGYEESIRTPLIIRCPYRPEKQLIAAMTLNIDIAPTLLDMAGVEIPKSMQGSSLVPLMSAQTESLRDEWFYEHLFEHPKIPKSEGIRDENFKYIHFLVDGDDNEMLFDLKNDPLEQRNLVSLKDYQEQLTRYRQLVQKYQKEMA